MTLETKFFGPDIVFEYWVRPVFVFSLHRSEVLKAHVAFLEPVMWKFKNWKHDNGFKKKLLDF